MNDQSGAQNVHNPVILDVEQTHVELGYADPPKTSALQSKQGLVPETGLEPVLPCGKRIFSTLEKGGESSFI